MGEASPSNSEAVGRHGALAKADGCGGPTLDVYVVGLAVLRAGFRLAFFFLPPAFRLRVTVAGFRRPGIFFTVFREVLLFERAAIGPLATPADYLSKP